MAELLTVSLDDSLDAPGKGAAKPTPDKRGPAPKWQQQVVRQMLNGLLATEAH
nr:hypothetical protein [uncultured Rhodoferax sp.]